MNIKELANAAADKAGLSIKQTVAANGYLLLAHAIAEHGSLKLPHGALGVLSQVAKERIGHAIPSGSLRWYRVQLMKDPEMVGRIVDLPPAFQLLVRAGQTA